VGGERTQTAERSRYSGTRWDPRDFPDLPWDVRENRKRLGKVEESLADVVKWNRRTAFTGLVTALSALGGLLVFILETLVK